MAKVGALERGRELLRNHAWSAAFDELTSAAHNASLEPEDFEGLALASLLLGKESQCTDFLTRAHQAFLSRGELPRATRCAFWLGFMALNNGDLAQGGGWLARARRIIEENHLDCVEAGYLLIPEGIRTLREGEFASALAKFQQASEVARRFRDTDLLTLSVLGQGRVLIRAGEVQRGVSLLDEAMIAVTSGEATPMVIGGVYCAVLDACTEIFDLRRASEWTTALEKWCASQPDTVPYRSHCLIRRAEILQLHGDWLNALDEAHLARERLSQPPPKPTIGVALYQIAELYRLRGNFAEAEQAYREASQWGRTPQPGFALLRLAQGDLQSASAAIHQAAQEVREPGRRAVILNAVVEIDLATREVAAAHVAAEELAKIARQLSAPLLHAMSDRAMGAVLLAEGDPRAALISLRRALDAFSEVEAPYEVARVRVLMALACREQGNHDSASLELEAACRAFQQMGAAPDLARVERLLQPGTPAEGPLTDREVEVLRLVATGMTNRQIAGKLTISEKTVARHISNIFTKLDINSRAAATAYAYQHQLLGSASA